MMDAELARGVCERALGKLMLDCGAIITPEQVVQEVESQSTIALAEIARLLNDETLSDFLCMDGIVDVLNQSGFSVTRHDF